jgi:hypothetical protein
VRALAAWGRSDDERFWDRFRAERRDRLRAAWDAGGAALADAASARAALAAEHAAEARPDPSRVHPSWWVRALQEESPAVRRAVAAHGPEPIGSALRAGLPLGPDDLPPDRPPHPEALSWALALWPERLVGGPATREDDPPVIAALTRLDRPVLYRLALIAGLAKLAYALGSPDAPIGSGARGLKRDRDRERAIQFQKGWDPFDPALVRVARLDLGAAKGRGHTLPRLGLITFGRLLARAEPHRTRWALQHLPYDLAKFMRTKMAQLPSEAPAPAILAWERRIFRASCARARQEGRLAEAWGDES